MSKLNYIDIEKSFNDISLRERIIIFVALFICVAWQPLSERTSKHSVYFLLVKDSFQIVKRSLI